MSVIQDVTRASSTRAVAAPPAATSSEIQDRFLKLLVTQLKNQDPLNPLDNAQITSQLSQISTVSGIEKLNATLQGLLEMAGLPYVGAGVFASSAAMDKEIFKRICLQRGLPVVDEKTRTEISRLDGKSDAAQARGDAAAAAFVITTAGPAAKAHRPHDDLGENHDGAEHDDGERHELDVAVFEVANFVGDDALEFVAVEALEQAGGDGGMQLHSGGKFGKQVGQRGAGEGLAKSRTQSGFAVQHGLR